MVAKGRGALAAQIVAIANDHGVAVRQDRDLVALLSLLEIDCPIRVAAVLAHLHRADRALQEGGV